jgi:hypothetical protein
VTGTSAGKAGADPIAIGVGTRVEIELIDSAGEAERLVLDIVTASQSDFAAGFLGAGTPLAQALIGQYAGDVVSYRVADMREVRVLSVARSQRAPAGDAAANRQSLIRDVVKRSETEDILRLALTVNTKWGDYDPEGILDKEDEKEDTENP